jgi:serine/threonine-protein kinase HipA
MVGAVTLEDGAGCATFEYDRDFAGSRIELAPLTMPLGNRLYSFPALPTESFHGLPGLLADSLPDRFGNALVDAWLATQGRTPGSFDAIERLCYTGTRGMGALEFFPATGPQPRRASRLRVDRLVALASEILLHRDDLRTTFSDGKRADELRDILRVGTSAGGARAKAVIAWNRETNEVRSGQLKADPGFEHWLLKFDGIGGNRDKESGDPKGYGAVEYAYHLMASECGVTMAECRLLEEGGRRHFMTRRFDRTPDGDKIHMQSLAAMAHLDFNLVGAHGYEQAIMVAQRLGLPKADLEQLFRRMVFNIVARNQDDHTKNIAFLMDRSGTWSLSPAFDVTYSHRPGGRWTSVHQMTLNGKRDGFSLVDFESCARVARLKRGRAGTVISEVREAVGHWHVHADKAGVGEEQRERIGRAFRLGPFV